MGQCVLEGEHIVAVYAQRVGAPRSLIVTDEALARPAVRALADRIRIGQSSSPARCSTRSRRCQAGSACSP
jgi:hypothetical protein